ncbi:MAG: hypothetical protein ACLPH3_09045 [Terracidiphilus sp.]
MKRKVPGRRAVIRLAAIMVLLGLLCAIYLLAIRPAALRWGATAEEIARSMPGDDIVRSPSFCATRAITISGRPEDIWPWLVQIGYGRAGFYGYDLIENLGSSTGVRSARSIRPELQHPKTGDVLPISAVAALIFDSIQPNRYLIWRGTATPPDGSFAWSLYPIDESHTRLISRIRLRYHWRDRRLALDLFTEFADPVAVPRILLGLKGRVEGRPPQSLEVEAVEIAVWVVAFAELVAAALLVIRRRRWLEAWLLGLGAGLSLLFSLYGQAPEWIGMALVCVVFAMMLRFSRTASAHSR